MSRSRFLPATTLANTTASLRDLLVDEEEERTPSPTHSRSTPKRVPQRRTTAAPFTVAAAGGGPSRGGGAVAAYDEYVALSPVSLWEARTLAGRNTTAMDEKETIDNTARATVGAHVTLLSQAAGAQHTTRNDATASAFTSGSKSRTSASASGNTIAARHDEQQQQSRRTAAAPQQRHREGGDYSSRGSSSGSKIKLRTKPQRRKVVPELYVPITATIAPVKSFAFARCSLLASTRWQPKHFDETAIRTSNLVVWRSVSDHGDSREGEKMDPFLTSSEPSPYQLRVVFSQVSKGAREIAHLLHPEEDHHNHALSKKNGTSEKRLLNLSAESEDGDEDDVGKPFVADSPPRRLPRVVANTTAPSLSSANNFPSATSSSVIQSTAQKKQTTTSSKSSKKEMTSVSSNKKKRTASEMKKTKQAKAVVGMKQLSSLLMSDSSSRGWSPMMIPAAPPIISESLEEFF